MSTWIREMERYEVDNSVLIVAAYLDFLRAENATQREEIARLKGLKGRPKIRASGMESATDPKPGGGQGKKRRRGGTKRAVTEERVITVEAPPGSRFKGYETTVVQDLVVRSSTIRYRRERWRTPTGETIVAPAARGARPCRTRTAPLRARPLPPGPDDGSGPLRASRRPRGDYLEAPAGAAAHRQARALRRRSARRPAGGAGDRRRGSASTTPAPATRGRTRSAPRSATTTSPGSPPPGRRAG